MDNNNQDNNPESNTPQSFQSQTDIPQQELTENSDQTMTETATNQRSYKKPLFLGVVILVIIAIGATGYIIYQNFQPEEAQPKLTQSTPTIPGKSCELNILDGNETVKFYESGNKYLLINTMSDPSTNNTITFNILFTGTHYYFFWTIPVDFDQYMETTASVYTVEEARQMSLDKSFQLDEVRKNPESCKDEDIEGDMFLPPQDIEFITVTEMTNDLAEATRENMNRFCQVCLEEFDTRSEQINCFGLGNMFTQYPDEVVEQAFDEYCLE